MRSFTPRPRALVPQLHPDLDAICAAALQRDPALRHRSASLFADSLERVLDKHPPLWPVVSRRRRLASWASRHPLLTVGALLGTLLLVVADVALLGSVRSEERELQTAVLHANATLASATYAPGTGIAEISRYAVSAACCSASFLERPSPWP